MIHKIEKINSVGRFRNFTASGQINFLKLTLIFGNNGGGKTTLTSILRSLTTNDPQLVKTRASTTLAVPQAIQVIERNPTDVFHTFGSSGWTVPLNGIEIFDIHFVNDNIFSGFDWNDEQKKQLHHFVIGAAGVTVRGQIEQNKKDKATSKKKQSDIENELYSLVKNGLNSTELNRFLSIQPTAATNITRKILIAEREKKNADANHIIQRLPILVTGVAISANINFETLIEDLKMSVETLQENALGTLFIEHLKDLEDNGVEGTETWLHTGFNYLKQKKEKESLYLNCPFCTQTIDENLDILKAYTIKFNEEFTGLTSRLGTHSLSVSRFNLETNLQRIISVKEGNEKNALAWAGHLPRGIVSPSLDVTKFEEMRSLLEALILNLESKRSNPSSIVNSESASKLSKLLTDLNQQIDQYNQNVLQYNDAIQSFKTTIKSVQNAQLELDQLQRIKARFDTTIASKCSALILERQNLGNLEIAYTGLIAHQRGLVTTFFSSYQTKVNHYLTTVFRTPFKIEDVIHVPPQGQAKQSKLGYKLTIHGQDISFDPSQALNVKDCLSEGDKSTIALAFFLAKLDIDPAPQDKILVFDDPLSSFDSHRRGYTVGILKNLVNRMKQVVVLSHNEQFLYEIGKHFPVAEKKTLEIVQNFIDHSSTLAILDLEELVRLDYFKQLDSLERFLTSPNINRKDEVLGFLRNVLEAHIRFKFYKELKTLTRDHTLGSVIRHIENPSNGVVFRDEVNRPDIILALHTINDISWKPHHGIPQPSPASLSFDYNTITIPELANLVQDTLDLVNSRL